MSISSTTGVERREYGKSHGYKINGVKKPGVTSVTKLAPKGALSKWHGDATAEYAVDNWDALALLPPSKRLAKLKVARFEDRDAAARRGTEVHRLGQALIDGELHDDDVPEELRGHVDSYVKFLDAMQPVVVAVELVVAHRALGYCGTLDVIADLPALTCEGTQIPPARWLLDVKTSRSGIFAETALQLAGYRFAEVFVDPESGEERPMSWLMIERCGAVHIRADGFDMRPVDTGPDVWGYFTRLAWLFNHGDDKYHEPPAEWVGAAVDPPSPGPPGF